LFHTQDGYLLCEDVVVDDLLKQGSPTPLYLYSQVSLRKNLSDYFEGTKGIDALIGYSIKANNNATILRMFAEMGAGAVTVSGNEVRLALECGFKPDEIILNGNGKDEYGIGLAVERGCVLNVDSEFDFDRIADIAQKVGKRARTILRVNPDVDPITHPYVATGLTTSKFGVPVASIQRFIAKYKAESSLTLIGTHCHLGSTITSTAPFEQAAALMLAVVDQLRGAGFDISWFNMGGGLGIDYHHDGSHIPPTPKQLIGSIKPLVQGKDLRLVLEPGRSLVGNAGVIVSRVLGTKIGLAKSFLVVDASMATLIRPSLYQAYHFIWPVAPSPGELRSFDVVGPICESGDFLATERTLPVLGDGDGIAILDAGAYGYSMASTYNMQMRPAELLVDSASVRVIRRAETYEDAVLLFGGEM